MYQRYAILSHHSIHNREGHGGAECNGIKYLIDGNMSVATQLFIITHYTPCLESQRRKRRQGRVDLNQKGHMRVRTQNRKVGGKEGKRLDLKSVQLMLPEMHT